VTSRLDAPCPWCQRPDSTAPDALLLVLVCLQGGGAWEPKKLAAQGRHARIASRAAAGQAATPTTTATTTTTDKESNSSAAAAACFDDEQGENESKQQEAPAEEGPQGPGRPQGDKADGQEQWLDQGCESEGGEALVGHITRKMRSALAKGGGACPEPAVDVGRGHRSRHQQEKRQRQQQQVAKEEVKQEQQEAPRAAASTPSSSSQVRGSGGRRCCWCRALVRPWACPVVDGGACSHSKQWNRGLRIARNGNWFPRLSQPDPSGGGLAVIWGNTRTTEPPCPCSPPQEHAATWHELAAADDSYSEDGAVTMALSCKPLLARIDTTTNPHPHLATHTASCSLEAGATPHAASLCASTQQDVPLSCVASCPPPAAPAGGCRAGQGAAEDAAARCVESVVTSCGDALVAAPAAADAGGSTSRPSSPREVVVPHRCRRKGERALCRAVTEQGAAGRARLQPLYCAAGVAGGWVVHQCCYASSIHSVPRPTAAAAASPLSSGGTPFAFCLRSGNADAQA
jgi:hypothetical protein